MSSYRLQELTVCAEDTVDVHDIELIQYINVDCCKLKRLLQGKTCSILLPLHSTICWGYILWVICMVKFKMLNQNMTVQVLNHKWMQINI